MFVTKNKIPKLWSIATVCVVCTVCLLLVSSLLDGQKSRVDNSAATDTYAKGATGDAGDFSGEGGRHLISMSQEGAFAESSAESADSFADKNNFGNRGERDIWAAPAQQLGQTNPMQIKAPRPKTSAVASGSEAAYHPQPAVSFTAEGAVEVAVPITHSGNHSRSAAVPIALELAANPQGLPPQMQDAVYDMALDFIEAMGQSVPTGTANTDANYLRAWKTAARNSDYQFRMRYGRVAFVQMNLLMAQEAAANGY